MKYFLLFSFLFLFSCKESSAPADVLKPEKMKAVMWDLMLAGETADYFVNADSSLRREDEHQQLYGQVLSIHKVTKPVFVKSLRWYQSRPDLFKPIVDSLHYQSIRQSQRSGNAVEP